MDDDLRELERAAAAGDLEAQAAVELHWARLGFGWWGDRLPEGVSRGEARGSYRFADGFEVPFARLEDGRLVPTVSAIREYTPGPPPAPFHLAYTAALFDAGYRCVLIDMSPCPTTSSRSIGGMMREHLRFQVGGGRIVYYGYNVHVKQTVSLVGLDRVMDWVADRETALGIVGKPPPKEPET